MKTDKIQVTPTSDGDYQIPLQQLVALFREILEEVKKQVPSQPPPNRLPELPPDAQRAIQSFDEMRSALRFPV